MTTQLVTKTTKKNTRKQKPCVFVFSQLYNCAWSGETQAARFCSCFLYFFIISIFHRLYFTYFQKGERSGQCHQTQG